MKLFALSGAITIALFASHGSAEGRDAVHKGDLVVVPIRGEISKPLLLFLRRAIKSAEANGAEAIIFEMNTYGGRLDAAEEISSALNRVKIPTYTFVNSNAGSAGALIALATQHIYMAPISAIGAAAPILSTGEDLPTTAREKTISYWSALIRASAARNGHNPDIGEAFMDRDKEVKIGDRMVHAKGSLLTLNAQEAAQKIGDKPLLADGIVESLADLVRQAKLTGVLTKIEPTGFERLASWLTVLAPLLLLGGILGAYLEFKLPGTTLPVVVSVLCFALFFLGHYIAGLAGSEVIALFVLGIVLVLVEIIFFAHSTIVFGVAGVFLMLASITWAMIDRYPGQRFFPTGEMLALPLLNLVSALAAAIVAIVILARVLPRTNLYKRFALSAASAPGPSFASGDHGFQGSSLIASDSEGIATTMLRPSGKAQFGGNVLDVVTNGEFVAAGTTVSVVQVDGMRVVVRPTV